MACFGCWVMFDNYIDPLASNTAARTFYERLGFTFVEEKRFGDDDTAVYILYRNKPNATS
jgi:aminoglycoside 6'-N-acetyltransferase